jgi:hypothetical protein
VDLGSYGQLLLARWDTRFDTARHRCLHCTACLGTTLVSIAGSLGSDVWTEVGIRESWDYRP